jgi:excisionase family DNA binding protein
MADRLAYSIAEACAVVGIRRTTLYKEIRSGGLRAVKIGERTVILADDLRRWLNGRPSIIPDQS